MLNNHLQKKSYFAKIFFIFSFFFITQLTCTEVAFSADGTGAGTTDELTCTMARIVLTLSGPMGKAIASIAIIALGIGLFMGKLSWGLAVATALGIAMIFGASSIVGWLSGGSMSEATISGCDGITATSI